MIKIPSLMTLQNKCSPLLVWQMEHAAAAALAPVRSPLEEGEKKKRRRQQPWAGAIVEKQAERPTAVPLLICSPDEAEKEVAELSHDRATKSWRLFTRHFPSLHR